jgi:hypothetical protein
VKFVPAEMAPESELQITQGCVNSTYVAWTGPAYQGQCAGGRISVLEWRSDCRGGHREKSGPFQSADLQYFNHFEYGMCLLSLVPNVVSISKRATNKKI